MPLNFEPRRNSSTPVSIPQSTRQESLSLGLSGLSGNSTGITERHVNHKISSNLSASDSASGSSNINHGNPRSCNLGQSVTLPRNVGGLASPRLSSKARVSFDPSQSRPNINKIHHSSLSLIGYQAQVDYNLKMLPITPPSTHLNTYQWHGDWVNYESLCNLR